MAFKPSVWNDRVSTACLEQTLTIMLLQIYPRVAIFIKYYSVIPYYHFKIWLN